jgi:hypothetical protein
MVGVGSRKSTRRLAALALAGAGVLAALAAAPAVAAASPGADCRPFSGEPCLLPFPNDLFTRDDPSAATGRRVDLPQEAMPQNTMGQRIDVEPYNRADGFDPGSTIIARVPGLDTPAALRKTDPVSLRNIARYRAKGAPIVVIDAKTGRRAPIWAELDSQAPDPANTTLLIHPAKLLDEGHTYVVALRHLKDADGKALDAPRWFERLRDGKPLPPAERPQRDRYRSIFQTLQHAGIGRQGLYEAWDFTVESRRSLTKPMLAIRDDAFEQLGDRNLADGKPRGDAPSFQISSVTDDPARGILREIVGSFQVPCYLETPNCAQGGAFNYASEDPNSVPEQMPGNLATAPFACIIPARATKKPARASLYGHGLFGSDHEIEAGNVEAMSREHDFMFCATEWWGLANDTSGEPGTESNIPYDALVLQNLSLFPGAGDRLEQAMVNALYLGRLMRNRHGFATDPAFQGTDGEALFDTRHLYYDGNSQGGIMGGSTIAISPDLRRGVVGVPGMDYGGLLLTRSSDFVGTYDVPLYTSYPDDSLHPLILDLMEQLWTRSEAEAYAANMTRHPLPDTPSHRVLMHVAYGDHQVTMYAAAVEARTIGARVYEPALDPARSRDRHLLGGIKPIPRFPFGGSGIVIWDSGPGKVTPPPFRNLPPTTGEDPHEDPRSTVAARKQKSRFLSDKNGAIVDVCGGNPCHTDDYTP